MRVEKDETGQMHVVDEPIVLEGEAADAFLAEMNRPRTPEEIAIHEQRMKECDEAYRRTRRNAPEVLEAERRGMVAVVRHMLAGGIINAQQADVELRAIEAGWVKSSETKGGE